MWTMEGGEWCSEPRAGRWLSVAEGSLWLLEPLVRWAKPGLGPGACDPPGRFVQALIGIAQPGLELLQGHLGMCGHVRALIG